MDTMTQQSSAQQTSNPAQTPPEAPAVPSTTTVIFTDATVNGTILGRDDISVEGAVVGKIRVEGTVTIERSGVVRGPIQADTVVVAGKGTRNTPARPRLQLQMTGSIKGDVTTCSFTIEDGSFFDGRSHMTKPGEEPQFLYQP